MIETRIPRRATIIDIARHAGVSRSTVSLVLQKHRRISQETRDRVEASIRALGYTYNRSAANLRRQTSQAIGLVINDIRNPFFAELTAGIQEGLEGSGFMVYLVESGEDLERQDHLLQSLVEHGVGGLIICPATGTTPAFVAKMAETGMPACFAVRNLGDHRFDYVVPDNHRAAEIAVAHLVALGHRRIAFIGGEKSNPVRAERLAGYHAALQAAGIEVDDTLCLESRPSRAHGIEDMLHMLALPNPPTAALGYNDTVAIAAMHALRMKGLEPGRDVAIVGFDGTPEGELSFPALTTVSLHALAIGRQSAGIVLHRIRAPDAAREAVTLTPSLIVRASCGSR